MTAGPSSGRERGRGRDVLQQRLVGKLLGVGMQERAYVSPLYPKGVRLSAIRQLSPERQRGVALAWFTANFRPLGLKPPVEVDFDGGSGVGGAPLGSFVLGHHALVSEPAEPSKTPGLTPSVEFAAEFGDALEATASIVGGGPPSARADLGTDPLRSFPAKFPADDAADPDDG